VLVIALADHRCDALEGFFVNDQYVAFTGDGPVAGYNGQLEVYWRDGQFNQNVPSILTTHGPGWTANDRGRGVAYVVVAYKADDEKGKNPVWEGRRPGFRWVLRGLRCYQARKDSTVGGSGAHRRNNPATWEWTENPIDIRYNWVRGIYAGDLVDQPAMLLVGRGLSAIEAPPQNVFARANLCDEVVGGEPRYRIGGVVSANEPFIEVESDIAAACGGIIVQPEGAVEINPGEARAPVAHFTDDDLIVGSKVSWSEFLGIADNGWINTVVARFVDPAQRWSMRGAPVRREVADIIADGAPREQTLTLSLVTNVRQAERIAEIARRFGRLWGRATVTLPPRFAGVEEGDWVTWQSNRYFGGATRTFQVDAWGSDQGWRHQLTLRQISASVFSDTAPLDDGVIAAQQPPPPQLQPPLVGAWALSATQINAGSVRVPALQLIGETDNPAAEFVIFEFVQQSAAPSAATVWTWAGASRPDVTRLSIPVPSGGTHYMAVSYVIDGVTSPRRVLGPVTLGEFEYPDGTSISDLQPAEFGSNRTQTANVNRVPFSRMEGGKGWQSFNISGVSITAPFPVVENGRVFVAANATASAGGQIFSLANSQHFPIGAATRLSVSAILNAFNNSGTPIDFWQLITDFRAGSTSISAPVLFADFGQLGGNQRFSAFVDVPSGATSLQLVLLAVSGGASSLQLNIAEPMVTSALLGQTIHPPFTPGPNADDAADVTSQNTAFAIANQSQWATWPGLTPDVLEAEVSTALADATSSLVDLSAIADDGILHRSEKPSVRERRANIMAEFPIWRDRAIEFGVALAIRNSYQQSYDELLAYLAAIQVDANTNTPIVRADFIAAFVNYADARERMIDAISVIASQRAQWAGVTGTGRPEDFADVTVSQPIVQLLNPATGRATSRRLTSQIIAGGVLQTLNVNPITATTSGGVSTINIAAHTVFDDAGSLSFNAGSIGGLAPSTMYFVWEANPNFEGGTRTYVATTNRNDLTVFGRRFVGSVTTPAAGSSGGSGGWGGGGGGIPGNPNSQVP